MITVARLCHNCKSDNIVLNGKNASKQQRYRCKDCKVTRVLDYTQKSRTLNMGEVARTYIVSARKRHIFRKNDTITYLINMVMLSAFT